MRKVSFLLLLISLLHGCSSTPQRSNLLYPDPISMSTSAICIRLVNPGLESEYRRSLWKEEINKRGVICTGGYSYYQVPQNTYDDLDYDIANSQKSSNERGETCIKYDYQYWYCEAGYELEWNKDNCLYECFPQNASSTWISNEDVKMKKPGGPPVN